MLQMLQKLTYHWTNLYIGIKLMEFNRTQIIKFFLDNIINLTAIVGENGSGKTQLLKNIGKMEDKNLIVYFENNQFYFKGNFQLVLKRKKIQKIDLEQKIYYYSPNYIGEKILYSNLFNDISINSIAGERYISKESKIHVDFLLNEQGSNFLKNIGYYFNTHG